MKHSLGEIGEEYARALHEYLTGGGETALHSAYEIGRRAVAEGHGVLELVTVHQRVLETVLLQGLKPEETVRMVKAAGNFFLESLSPFEMTHRAFREVNSARRRLNESLEEEAKRFAHALHDEAGQLLTSLHLKLAEVTRDLPPPARERFQEFQDLLGQMGEELRRLSHELRPTILDDLGLVPALDFLAQGISTRTGLSITVESSLDGRLPRSLETTLYRVVQQALANVVKHAQASRVGVSLQPESRRIGCSVRDDGIGFDVAAAWAKRGLGLIGIRDRLNTVGGKFEIISAPGQGTELLITIPMETEDANSCAAC